MPYNQLSGKIETECPLTENLSLEGNCFHCPLPAWYALVLFSCRICFLPSKSLTIAQLLPDMVSERKHMRLQCVE